MELADLQNRFVYHAPTGNKGQTHESVRTKCFDLAQTLNMMLPESREKSLAITHLEEVMMWSNAAVARYEEPS